MQKRIAEADKLFERGKSQEGIAKLKAALTEEPLNQLVATRLANAYLQEHAPDEAAKVYGGLAKRLSEAGKSQVAIAIFKQALELMPDDIALRMRFAQECESIGKLGDAFLQGQIVLSYYLRRKKFFDASNILPLMARAQPKDDKIKIAWIEVLQLCQAEQKLVHLLVALAGPPGVVSQDFPQGGDPATLSPAIYEGLKRLVAYFPRDPKVAYALAWCAYRRGQAKEFFRFLRECLRREPDFCLAILLFSRYLAENKRLNESLFVFKYYKERMAADRNTDMLTLNRQMETFVEKNGWIKFVDDSGEVLDTAGFLKVMTGREQKVDEKPKYEEVGAQQAKEKSGSLELPPAEIEIGGLPPADDLVVLTATGQSIDEVKAKKPPKEITDPMRIQAELIKATIEATIGGMGATGSATQSTVVQPVVLPVIQAAAQAAAVSPEAIAQAQAAAAKSVESGISVAAPPAEKPEPDEKEDATGKVEGFDGEAVEFTSLIRGEQLESSASPSGAFADPDATRAAAPPPAAVETVVAAPGDVTRVATPSADQSVVHPLAEGPAEPAVVATEGASPEASEEGAQDGGSGEAAAPPKKTFDPFEDALPAGASLESLRLENEADERTEIFSPIEVLDAAKVMQNHDLSDVSTKLISLESIEETAEKPLPEEERREADKTRWKILHVEGDRTVAFTPVEAVQAAVDSRRPHDAVIKAADPPKPPLPAPAAGETGKLAIDPQAVEASASREVELAPPPPEPAPAEPAAPSTPSHDGAFMPIPTAAATARPGAGEEKVDLGDDLLEGPTRIFTQPTAAEKTEHLIKEIKHDLKNKVNARLNIDMLMRKAERYTAKRNYYLARKTLRHAQALGADEEAVKAKLREIRKLELPDGLYNTISSDRPAQKVDTAAVIDQLEHEFDLAEADGTDELGREMGKRIEKIFLDADPRTILDFGVGLHEMGFFRQAEALFIRLVEDFPDYAFDAYYLAAMSKLSRRDYAGAASILKRLSSDNGKTDLEKIQIYYALGETFEKMRQKDRSRKFFKKVAELDANYRNIRHKLGE